ncbi:sla2 Src-like adaptor 2 [Elasticomyces elasticus]|nr:sla2 Src-like adaptor 2 [Elasticomyces elasticus]
MPAICSDKYNQRMKELEGELAQLNGTFQQQIQNKDDLIGASQEQVNTWRTRYEALAKLDSPLQEEHLELLQNVRGVQLKAASAQESVDQQEKLERELKTKNLELAAMIRERDRALHDKDRTSGGHKDEVEKLKRGLHMVLDRADITDRAKGSELSAMLPLHNREIADLTEALRDKTRSLDNMQSKTRRRQLRPRSPAS